MGLEIIVNNEKLDVGGVKIGLTFNNPLFDDKNTDRSYSFAFGVQLTPTNKRILKHAERIDSPILDDEFPCTLIIDSALYLEGVLIIKKRTNRGYRCYWTNESTSAIKTLRDIKINELIYEPTHIATPDINWIFYYKQSKDTSGSYNGLGIRSFEVTLRDKRYSFWIDTTPLRPEFDRLKNEINNDIPGTAEYIYHVDTGSVGGSSNIISEEYHFFIINIKSPIKPNSIKDLKWYSDGVGVMPNAGGFISTEQYILDFLNPSSYPTISGLPTVVSYNWTNLWTDITSFMNAFETSIKADELSQNVCFPTIKNIGFYEGKNPDFLGYINYYPYVFQITQTTIGQFKHNFSPLIFLRTVLDAIKNKTGLHVEESSDFYNEIKRLLFYNNNSLDEDYRESLPPTTNAPPSPAYNTFKEFIYPEEYLPEMSIEDLFIGISELFNSKITYKGNKVRFINVIERLKTGPIDWTKKTSEKYNFDVLNTKGFEIKYPRDDSDASHKNSTQLDGYSYKAKEISISPKISTTKVISEQDEINSSRNWLLPEVNQKGNSKTTNQSQENNKPKFLIYQGYQHDSDGNEYPMASNHFVDVSNNRIGDLSLLIKGEEGIYEKRYRKWLSFISGSKLVEKQLILAAHEINELIKWEEPIRKIYHNKGTLKGIVKSIEFSVDANGISSPVNAEIVAEGISKLPVFEQVAEVITPAPPSPAPTISSISYAPLVSNQTKDIVIIGTNFTATTTVSIIKGANIITVNSVTFDSPTQLTVNVTSGTVVSGFDVTVNNGNPVTSVDGLFVEDTQKINFINPATTTNDYADLGTILNGARTVELFITLNSAVEPDDTVIGRNVTNGKLFMAFNTGNDLKVQIDNGTGNKFAYADNPLTVGTRYRVSLRLDSTDKMRLFMDGVAQANNADVNTAITNQTVSAYMAKFANLNIRFADCTIERLDIWSTSRTQAQIAAGINRVPTPGEPGLIDSFPFLNETGTTSTGINGNTITLHTATAGGTTHINNQMRQIV